MPTPGVEEGRSWQIDLPGGDTVSSTYECVSNTETAWIYRQDFNDPSPLLFLDSCYLYLQTRETIRITTLFRNGGAS